MDPHIRSVLEHRLATFGEHPATLGKFTRTMFAKDLRRTLVTFGDSSEQETGARLMTAS